MRHYRGVTQIVKKQRPTGLWASNILGVGPSRWPEIKEPGTVYHYMRLLELGLDPEEETLQTSNRIFYRLLSRDPDPKLLFEYQKAAKTNPAAGIWARRAMQEAVAAALARAGCDEDPRLRGAAHRIAGDLAQYLRSDLAANPFLKKGTKHVLHPDATPPRLHSIMMLAFLPRMQRDRAGLIDRLAEYLTQTETKKTYVIQVGPRSVKPTDIILGEPIHNDSTGRPKDLPFALYWMELLARLGMLSASAASTRAFTRLARDCDDGVWTMKNLRSFPKGKSPVTGPMFPLEIDEKSAAARRADVTFRLALIAKLAGLDLEFV